MEKINHADMVKQLAKSGQDIILQLTPNSAHLWHMATGIAGESGELLEAVMDCSSFDEIDVGNVTEELGDSEFYLEGFRQEMGFKREDTTMINVPSVDATDLIVVKLSIARLSMYSNKLLDETKKMAIYVKPINAQACMDDLKLIEVHLAIIRNVFDISHEECLDHNVDKLGDRYDGHQYSNEQAQDRSDKNE